jgi:multidrug efflux pump subunit AcrB
VTLADFSVKRPQFTVVLFLMLAALGVQSIVAIPKAEDPTFPIATFSVVAVYPGATPSDVERQVIDPIETKLKALDDVKSIKTTIEDGLGVTQIEFIAGSDADKKNDDVLREINALRPTLPAELRSLEVQRFNAANVNILQVALVSETAPYAQLESLSDRLRKRLETVPGVNEVKRWGFPKQEVRVALDLERLAELHIPAAQVLSAIQLTNVNLPGGSVDVGPRRLSVKTSGDYQSLDEIRNTPVGAAAGRVLKLSDIADVQLRNQESTTLARYNGRRAVFVTANEKERQNIFAVRDGLFAALDGFTHELPAGVTLERGFDQSRNVAHRLHGFVRDFGLAILLVLVTLLPLGLRASGIVMVSIPLSLAIGVALLNLAGFSINQLSIVGFVIALGLLVDDSIVVVENITRFLREGHSRREAAIEATRQIGVSVLGCTATLVFAFLPLLFLPGVAGQFIRSLPLAVVFTILASLFVALTIIPFLSSVALKGHEEAEGNWFLRTMNRGIERSYRPVLHAALRHPVITLALAVGLFVGSLMLVPRVGFSLFPKAGTPQFLVKVETPDGSSLDETDRATRFVEGVLKKHPEVASYMTNVGQGNPMVYYNVGQQNEKPSYGELFVQLRDNDAVKTPLFLDQLREELKAFVNAKIELKEFENGPAIEAPIAIRLFGEDQEQLKKGAAEIQRVLEATPGTRYVRNPLQQTKTDLKVEIDRERAALLGVPLAEIDRTVRLGLAGLTVGSYREPGSDLEARDISVTLPRPGHASLAELDRLTVASQSGAQVPLAQVATLGFVLSPTTMNHYNKERVVTVSAFVHNGYNTDRVTKAVLAQLATLQLPPGYRIVPAGEIESRQESFGGLGIAIIIAAFGVLAILVLEFRTFKSTMIVASVIPLGVVGGIFALWLSGNSLSFTATIGFIALLGIEVKNSILLVDFTNQLRQAGVGLDEAIERAGQTRFVPILLTTMTALGGLLPLALENSSLYSPLAWVIIGGLVTSTVLTRVVTPVMYKLLAPSLEPVSIKVEVQAPAQSVSGSRPEEVAEDGFVGAARA